MSNTQSMEERFNQLNIHVSPERCLEDRKMVEDMKLLLPIAFDLFKPDLLKFIKSELDLQKKELVEKMMQLKPLYDIEYRDGKALIELEEAIQIINP